MGLRRKKKIAIVPDSAKQAEEIRRSLVQADHLSVSPPLVKFDDVGGTTLAYEPSCEAFWAKITGSASPYSWTEQKRLPNGTWQTCCRTGTNAYEVNNVLNLNGSYQHIYPDCNGTGVMHFQDVRKGGMTSNCTVTVNGILQDISGRQGSAAKFCPAPTLYWTLDSPGTYPTKQNGIPVSGGAFTIKIGMSQGTSHTLHVYSAPDVCGQRFDSTIQVSCPGPVSMVVPAAFDLSFVGATFYVGGCGVPNDLPVAITSSQPLCQSTQGCCPWGISGTAKITSYPYSVTFTATAPDSFPASDSTTLLDCGVYAPGDNCGVPVIMYRKWKIVAFGCTGASGRLAGAKITLTGDVTGVGTTTGGPDDRLYLDSYTPPCNRDLAYAWTVEHPRFKGASYDSATTLDASQQGISYGSAGSLCPVGGNAGSPAEGYACAGGCAVPLKTTLQATILGQEISLVNDVKTPYSVWIGRGVWATKAANCDDIGARCPSLSNAGVPFQAEWNGIGSGGGSRPFVYVSSRNGVGNVTTCPVPAYHPDGSYAWTLNCSGASLYDEHQTSQCFPLLISGSCTTTVGVTYGVNLDGTCGGEIYTADYSWIITE